MAHSLFDRSPSTADPTAHTPTAGRRTLTRDLSASSTTPVQAKRAAAGAPPPLTPRQALQLTSAALRPDLHLDVAGHAAAGIRDGGGALPHLDAIQRSFGAHDVGGIEAHVGGPARTAAAAIGAEAYATGSHVAFGEAPSLHTAAHEAAHVIQQRGGIQLSGGVGQEGDVHERHADAVADRVVQGRSSEDLLDGYQPRGGGGGQTQAKAEPSGPTAAPKGPGALVVADGAPTEHGQMTKTAFLAALEAEVIATAVATLPPTWSASECPDLREFFARQRAAEASSVDRLVRRYAGGGAATAIQCIGAVTQRLKPALAQWAAGKAMSWTLTAAGVPEAIAADLTEAPAAATPAAQPGGGGVQRRAAATPTVADLGPSHGLDAGTAARMDQAFGRSVGAVQLHTSPDAARHVRDLGVDAIAVGSHIAFAAGAYQPGTPAGDHLVAHELGHTAQQAGHDDAVVQRMPLRTAGAGAAEADADRMADAVVDRLHGGGAEAGAIDPGVAGALEVRGGCLGGGNNNNHGGGNGAPVVHNGPVVLRTVQYVLTAAANSGSAVMTSNGQDIANIGTVYTASGTRANCWYTNYYDSGNDARGTKACTALLYLVACAAVNAGATDIEISNANRDFEASFAIPLGFAFDPLGGPCDLVGNAMTVRNNCQAIAAAKGYQLPGPGGIGANSHGAFDQHQT